MSHASSDAQPQDNYLFDEKVIGMDTPLREKEEQFNTYKKETDDDDEEESEIDLNMFPPSENDHNSVQERNLQHNDEEEQYKNPYPSEMHSLASSESKKKQKKNALPRYSISSSSSSSASLSLSDVSSFKKRKKNKKKGGSGGGLTHDEIIHKKQELLFELDRYEMKGKRYFRKLTLASSLEEIELAFHKIELDIELDDAISYARQFIVFVISIIEKTLTNSYVKRYLPFEFRLNGWSQSILLDMQSSSKYDTVLKKLYIKYRSRAQIAPEVHLLGLIVMSGVTFHLGNTFINCIPGLGDYAKDNPQFMPQFMSSVNNIMGNGQQGSSSPGPGQQATPSPSPNANGGGGGLMGTLGSLFNTMMGSGVSNASPSPSPMPMPKTQAQQQPQSSPPTTNMRPQMKGPPNLDNLFQDPSSQQNVYKNANDRIDNVSNVSESELSELPDDISLSGILDMSSSKGKKTRKTLNI